MIRPLECPICRKPVCGSVSDRPGTFPFCSTRCRQVDLLRWCQGKYAIVEPLTPERLLEEDEKRGGELLDEE